MDPHILTFKGNPNYPLLMQFNNPAAVLITKQMWPGKTTRKGQKKYESFEFYHQGITAFLRIIQKYYFEEKARTIEKLVNRYASPGALLTPYIEHISKGTGFRPRQTIPWKRESIFLLTQEICRYENKGRNPMLHPDLFAFCWLKIEM